MELKTKLKQLKEHGESKKERIRAEAILLYEKGYKKVKIADILGVSQRSIFIWFAEYNKYGISSLSIKRGVTRRARILKEDECKSIIMENIEKYPNQPKKVYAITVDYLGKKFSYSTFKRFLKKHSI